MAKFTQSSEGLAQEAIDYIRQFDDCIEELEIKANANDGYVDVIVLINRDKRRR
ncbi:hypothetical protein [Alteribacter populi]|uniref:hypothetical protein n=1 Tax=Alteribacter populi TaxID=2011011 RepID=UPI0012FFB20F|nr:hypothetical protein [Alteribacter populi]